MFSGVEVVVGLLEDPGIADGAASDHGAVAAEIEHGFYIFGGDDVAVGDEGEIGCGFFDFGEPGPVGFAGVALAAGAAVYGECLDAVGV